MKKKKYYIAYRDNLTGKFISKKRFKQLSRKRTSADKIYYA